MGDRRLAVQVGQPGPADRGQLLEPAFGASQDAGLVVGAEQPAHEHDRLVAHRGGGWLVCAEVVVRERGRGINHLDVGQAGAVGGVA